mmetsp:Transcript_1825/g.2747  ORF Transcript_1825/g.2747 Transcript_1825/m.2747 type:complete len:87 (+) Transcript_1825:160-420(+)
MHMTPVNTNFAPIVMEVGGRQSNAFAYLCSKWPIRLDTILAVLMKNLARTDLSLLFKFNKHFKYNIKLSVEEYLGMRFQGYDDEYY